MSLASDILRIVMRQIPWLVYAGVFRFRVTKHTSGRLDVEAVDSIAGLVIAPIPLRDVWAGVPGCRVELTPGDEVLLSFIDRDPSQAVIVGFAPLAQSKAVRVEIDASEHVDLGDGASAVHRVNDAGTAGTLAAAANAITITAADGSTATLTFAYVAPNITITPSFVTPFNLATKATEGSPKVRA